MATTIKSFLRISMVMRNLGVLTNYTMTKRFSRMSAYYCSNSKKESLVSARPYLSDGGTPAQLNQKSLRMALEQSKSPEQLFGLVRANEKVMMVEETMLAFNSLMNIYKTSEDKSEKMLKNPGFVTLCEILKNRMRYLNAINCVGALKAMVYFDVPTTSIIVQMILQMLRHNINQLSLKGLSFLDFLLEKCEPTPLVNALLIAVPIVYETNLTTKLDRENILSIKDALSYLSKRSTNTETFNILIHALMDCRQPIEPLIAQSILWSFCDLQCYPNELPEALNYVQNILASHVNRLDRTAILMLLKMIGRKLRAREQYYYHEGFVDACASSAISEDWGLKDAMCLLARLVAIGHTQISLLDYIAGKCFENPALLESCSPEEIADLVVGFSAADYKPIFWDVVQESITSDRMLQVQNKHFPLSKLSLNLLALDVYCPKLLKKTFEQCAGRNFYRGTEKRRILIVYQAVKTLYPQFSGPWPFENVSELQFPYRIHDFPLQASLEGALGGSSYVISDLRSKLGHVIDHAIVMRKGGFPVAINTNDLKSEGNSVVQLEDIKPPADCQVILILNMSQHAYSINTQRLKAAWSLQIKSLEALSGYTVIPIRSSMWMSIPASEQIPYLMQAIRLKCDEQSVSVNS